ncbi:MFS transporter [Streptomyces hainanensis]|uniref:MFS transporter n=1 Tax=Streptomyces hainanensis TaxID=402648 RepID=A0A4R4T1P9_9ACTN|nr:MFS transporter [Streptomyces hainanensis]TDC70597.1 MFS transporter [Streptomyces hainanensis]
MPIPPSHERSPRAGRREWLGLALLALPLFVLAMDASVLFLAAPHIGADLDPSPTQWLWALDVYGFVIAGFLVTMGAVGDRVGRRRLLLVGSLAFAAASTWAALAASPEGFVAARAALGFAGATLMPSTLALIRTMFRDDRQRSFAIAVWMTTFSVGVAVGPLIGGALLQAFWWGSVFLVAVPVMLLAVALGPVLLPESRDPDPAGVDLPSVALSVVALITIVYALKELVTVDPELLNLGVLAVGLVSGAVFTRRQRGIANPLVDPLLFRSRAFRTALFVLTVGIFTVTAVNFLVPQFLQSVAGLAPLPAGLLTVPIALSAIAGSLAAPGLAGRWGPAAVIVAGAALSLAGYLVLARAAPDRPLWIVVVGGALAVLGLSPATVLTTDLVVASAPEERAGSAAALSETSGELGVALGIAIMGTILTTLYRFGLTDGLPADLDPTARDAARDGLPSAERASEALPPELADALMTAARESFASAFGTVALLCAGITVALGAAVALRLRRPGPAPDRSSAPGL